MLIALDLKSAAEDEARRMQALRGVEHRDPPVAPGTIFATRLNGASTRAVGGSCVIWFVRATIVDRSGRLIENLLIPVRAERTDRDACADVLAAASHHASARATEIALTYRDTFRHKTTREGLIHDRMKSEASGLVQLGLFDRRAARASVLSDAAERDNEPSTASLSVPLVEIVLLLYADGS